MRLVFQECMGRMAQSLRITKEMWEPALPALAVAGEIHCSSVLAGCFPGGFWLAGRLCVPAGLTMSLSGTALSRRLSEGGVMVNLIAAPVNLNHPRHYVTWGPSRSRWRTWWRSR